MTPKERLAAALAQLPDMEHTGPAIQYKDLCIFELKPKGMDLGDGILCDGLYSVDGNGNIAEFNPMAAIGEDGGNYFLNAKPIDPADLA